MPNCFALTKKGENKFANLQTVDDEMREYFGEEPSKDSWLYRWYDSVGLLLACGKTWAQIRENLNSSDQLKVVDYLEERYDTKCWSE